MEVVERLLWDLSSVTNESNNVLEAYTIVSNIFACISSEGEALKTERMQQLALLFTSDSPPSLLTFLATTVKEKDKDIVKSKVFILKMIAEVFKYFDPSDLENFSDVIFQSSFDVMKRDESSEVKAAAAIPIKNILRKELLVNALNISISATYENLLDDANLNKKLSKGLRGELFKVLGLLVSAFAGEEPTSSNVSKIMSSAIRNLQSNFEKGVQPEFPIISGCFSCIDRCILYQGLAEEFIKPLFMCLLKSIIAATSDDLHRYAMTSKALRVLKKHAHLFKRLVSLNIATVYKAIMDCCTSETKALVKHSKDALHSVLIQLARFVSEEKHPDAIVFVTNLVKKYSSLLSGTTAQSEADILYAVNGLSALAPALPYTGGSAGGASCVNEVVMLLIHSCNHLENAFVSSSGVHDFLKLQDSAIYLKSQYLLAVTCVLNSIIEASSSKLSDKESDLAINFLKSTALEITNNYMYSSDKHHGFIKKTLCCFFNTVYKFPIGSSIGEPVIASIVNRAVSRSNDADGLEVSDEGHLYGLYAVLACEIFNPIDKGTKSLLTFYDQSTHAEKYSVIANRLYGALLSAALSIIGSFDLSYGRSAEEEEGLQAANPADQELYLNLVSFLELILPEVFADRFVVDWALVYIQRILEISKSHPMLSASYRLARLCIQISVDQDYFSSSIVVVIKSFVDFLTDHIVYFEGELLDKCLDFLFSIPANRVSFEILFPAVTLSLTRKIKCKEAFDLIEQYILIDSDEFYEHVDQLLPLIPAFLIPRSKTATEFLSMQSKSRTRKLKDKSVSKISTTQQERNSSESLEFMAVRLLGRLGGRNQGILSGRTTSHLHWNYEAPLEVHLSCDIGAKEIALQIGNCVPVLLELCNKSADRQSKVLACECLHSIVIYMIGKASIDPLRTKKSIFADSYAVIFPSIIALASSTDPICRDLYSKLLTQIVHWFSGKDQVHVSEPELLIDALLEDLCVSSDATTRETCAKALTEYFVWAIKQTSSQELKSGAGTIDSLISRLMNFCANASEKKRLGAAIVFGKICRCLREEASLLNIYVLKITWTLFQGHRLGGSSREEFSFVIQQYISTINKAILKNNDEAHLLRDKRRSYPGNLSDLVAFFWQNVAHIDLAFRRKCMQGFLALAPLVVSNNSCQLSNLPFVEATLVNQKSSLFNGLGDTLNCPIVFDFTTVSNYFSKICATLDVFNWLFKNKILSPIQIFSQNQNSLIAEEGSSKRRKVSSDETSIKLPNNLLLMITSSFLDNYDVFLSQLVINEDQWNVLNPMRIETLRRVLQLLTNILIFRNDSVVLLLSEMKILSKLSNLIIPVLVQENVCYSSNKHLEIDNYLPAALFQFLHNLGREEDNDEKCEFLQNLQNGIRGLMQFSLKSTFLYLERLHRLIGFFIENNFDILAFGPDYIAEMKQHAFVILTYVSRQSSSVIASNAVVTELLLRLACELCFSVSELIVSVFSDAKSFESLGGSFCRIFLASLFMKEKREAAKLPIDQNTSDLIRRALVTDLKGIFTFIVNNRDLLNLYFENTLLISQASSDISQHLKSDVISLVGEFAQNLKPSCLKLVLTASFMLPVPMRPVDVMREISLKTLEIFTDHLSTTAAITDSFALLPYLMPGVAFESPVRSGEELVPVNEGIAALEKLVASKFPQNSHAYDSNPIALREFGIIFQAYLKCLSVGALAGMITPLLPTLAEAKNHKHFDWIRLAFADFVSNFYVDEELKNLTGVLELCSDIFFNSQNLDIKLFIFEHLFIPILNQRSSKVLEMIFTSPNAKALSLSDLILSLEDTECSNGFQKAVAFTVIGIIYDRCSLDSITGSITASFAGVSSTGKEITQSVIRAAYSILKSSVAEVISESERFVFQSAFNCLSLVIAKTQSSEDRFNSFIFEQSGTSSYWSKIIDLATKESQFSDRLETFETRNIGSNQSVSRMRITAASHTRGPTSQASQDPLFLASSLSQGSSLMFTGFSQPSSFNEDDFDITESILLPETDDDQEGDIMDECDADMSSPVVMGLDDVVIELELKDLNLEPCMGTLVRVLQRMDFLFAAQWKSETLPAWLLECVQLLTQDPSYSQSHLNIRLFILRLFMNQPVATISSRWAQNLLKPVLQSCIRDLCGSPSIHYFMRDLLLLFSDSWSNVNIDENLAVMCSQFISYLLRHIYVNDIKILQLNVKHVIALIKTWLKSGLVRAVDFSPIVVLLASEAAITGGAHGNLRSKGSESVRKRLTALQILKAVLEVNYRLIDSTCITDLMKNVCLSIKFSRKEVADSASSVAGQCLNYLFKDSVIIPNSLSNLRNNFITSVNDFLISKLTLKDGFDLAASCLNKISKEFPGLLTRELFLRIIAGFSKMKSKAKAEFLEVLKLSTSEFEGISIVQTLKPYITSLLADLSTVAVGRGRGMKRVHAVQLSCLEVLMKYATVLDKPIIESIVSSPSEGLCLLINEASSVEVREAAFKLLMKVYSLNTWIHEIPSLKRRVKLLLIRGLVDADCQGLNASTTTSSSDVRVGIRKQVLDFFDTNFGLAESPVLRLKDLMTELYDGDNVGQWLNYSSFLILSSLELKNDFSKVLFPSGLADDNDYTTADFSQDNFSTSSSFTLGSMVPLFALERTQSQKSQNSVLYSQSQSGPSQIDIRRNKNQLRKTQDAKWSQTQGASQRNRFVFDDMATQYLLGNKKSALEPNGSMDSFSSQQPKTQIRQKRSVHFLETNSTEADELANENDSDVKTHGFAEFRRKVRTKRDLLKVEAVPIYRKYRTGELPDIAITLTDIFRPIQALCLRDRRVASTILESIFKTLLKHADLSDSAIANILRKNLLNMVSLSGGSSISNPEFVSTLFSISLNCISEISQSSIVQSTFTPFYYPPEPVANMAIMSRNVYSGIRLLEEQLYAHHQVETGTSESDEAKETWLQLTKLYGSLKETDILLGISAKISRSEESQYALDAEASGLFPEAIEIYSKLIEDETSNWSDRPAPEGALGSINVEFWNSRSIECLNKLLEWSQLDDNIHKLVADETAHSSSSTFETFILSNQKCREKYLQKYVRCISHSLPLLEKIEPFVEEYSSRGDLLGLSTKVWIESVCAADLALCYAKKGRWSKVQHYVDLGYDSFLENWISISPSGTNAKKDLLQNLQRIVELEDGVKLSSFSLNTSDCLKLWNRSRPSKHDPITIWDDIINGRYAVTSIIEEESSGLLLDIAKLHTELALTAVEQGILYVVNSQLVAGNKLQKKVAGRVSLSNMDIFAVFSYNMKKIAKEQIKNSNDVNSMYAKTTLLLDNELLKKPSNTQVLTMKGELMTKWGQYEYSLSDSESKNTAQLRFVDSFNSYREAVASVSATMKSAGEVHAKFATFCNEILDDRDHRDESTGIEGSDTEVDSDGEDKTDMASSKRQKRSNYFEKLPSLQSDELASHAVSSYLKGLMLGNSECRDCLLRLTSLIGRFPVTVIDAFNSLDKIPPWYFLKYSSQLMGRLDTGEKLFVKKILEILVNTYPKAVYYQFKVTQQCLSRSAKELISDLITQLNDESYEKFIASLCDLTHPNLRVKDQINAVKRELRAKNEALATQLFEELKEMMKNTSFGTVDTGSFNTQYMKSFQKQISSKKIDLNGKLSPALLESLLLLTQSIPVGHEAGRFQVSLFSQWLASFDSSLYKIEVPGSYLNDDKEPFCEDLTYIIGVDQNLLVMESIRKPKRVTLYGSDGKEYKFLVKGGEDLRTDERIQHLFNLMNSVLATVADGLSVQTYKVIPIALNLGILEWVSNTSPLKTLIFDSMSKDQEFRKSNEKAFKNKSGELDPKFLSGSEERLSWIKYKGDPAVYHNNFAKVSVGEATTKWKAVIKKIPADFLRKKFVSMNYTAEDFHSFRSKFAKSLSVSSIYSYICGIGDRHLDNLLIDTATGAVVQIDFDMCFGKATFILPVPEFIPFRLTPQIVSVLQPLEGVILLRRYMVTTMSALRTTSSIKSLSNVLEIYLNDPVSDWLKSEKERGDLETLRENEKWEPRRRIESTLRKLKGVHPIILLLEDLAINKHVKQNFTHKSLTSILKSSCEKDRSRKGYVSSLNQTDILEVGEQIDSLMNIASDPNILVRQWEGLMTWM